MHGSLRKRLRLPLQNTSLSYDCASAVTTNQDKIPMLA
jgi:hypothetical protein